MWSLLIIPTLAAVFPADATSPSHISSRASGGSLAFPLAWEGLRGLQWKTNNSYIASWRNTKLLWCGLREWINRQINKTFSWCGKERKKAYNFRFGKQQFSWACSLWGLWWMVLHSTLHPDLHAVKFATAISDQSNCPLKCRVITERWNTW